MNFIDLKIQQKIIKEDLNSRIQKVLSHGKYVMGPEVEELEEKLAEFVNSKHCITVSSGTDALLISLMSLGIKPGDEVITSPFSWISTTEVIVMLGATPVFVDIDPDTCNLDHTKIEKSITDKTKALMPVSLFGQPSKMDSINTVAKKHKIPVIEDAAQSFGATYLGKKSCNLSSIGCTSFFPSKPLGCYGDGGAIFTNNSSLAKVCREIWLNGQENKNKFNRIGIQGRLDTLQAAILLAKMEIFPDEVDLRRKIAQNYNNSFVDLGINHVKETKGCLGVYAQYTIFSDQRNLLQNFLTKNMIPSSIYYSHPIYHHKPYKKYKVTCRVTEKVSKQVLSLPMHPYLIESDQEKIVGVIKKFIER